MEKLYCFYGARFWSKVIAWFEIIWFSFFLGYLFLRVFGIFGHTIIFLETTLHNYFGVNVHNHQGPEGGFEDVHSGIHRARVSMMVSIFVTCYVTLGLIMGILLLVGVIREKTRYLECWLFYSLFKYVVTTVILIMDKTPICDFILYSIAFMFGTAFCVSAVRTHLLEIRSKEEQQKKIVPFNLSLDNVLVKFINLNSKQALGRTNTNIPYQHL